MIGTSLHQSEPVLLPGRPMGRRVRSIAGYALLTALMIVTPMLLVFVPAALFHCGIRNGRRATWLVAALALGIAAMYVLAAPAQADLEKLAWSSFAALALGVVMPSVMAVPLVERGERFGRVLVFLLLGSAVGLAATEIGSRALIDYSPFAAHVADAQQSNARVLQFYRGKGAPAEAMRMMERWASYSTFVLPGFMLIMLSLVFILSLLMFGRLKAWREWSASRGDAAGFGTYLFRNLSLPDWVLFAFVLGGLTPIASGMLQKVAANTLTVVAFLYIVQGLAIFRFLLAAMGAGLVQAMFGWMMLAFLTLLTAGVPVLLLGVAGLFDSFFDFRHFKKRKDDSHESHSD